jgi:hypothetical protein
MSAQVEPVAAAREVVDVAIDSYVAWREECDEVRDAFKRWSMAPKADQALASVAYLAALDREEVAADVYADAMQRLGDAFVDGPLAEPQRLWHGFSS